MLRSPSVLFSSVHLVPTTDKPGKEVINAGQVLQPLYLLHVLPMRLCSPGPA